MFMKVKGKKKKDVFTAPYQVNSVSLFQSDEKHIEGNYVEMPLFGLFYLSKYFFDFVQREKLSNSQINDLLIRVADYDYETGGQEVEVFFKEDKQ